MQIEFHGANQEVTGSNYLIEAGGRKILIDCGLFQGSRFADEKNYDDFLFNPQHVDSLILTHAHLDHCGRIPKLIGAGFKGNIYSTVATKELSRIVLEDAADLMFEEAKREDREPLYNRSDLNCVFDKWQNVEYHSYFYPANGIKAVLNDAGHILGSAGIEIEYNSSTVAFSGDVGNPPVPMLRPTETFNRAKYLIIESTYGGRIHEPPRERSEKLQSEIISTMNKGGTLMIPAFALERTQEILYEINQLSEGNKIPKIPVFLDSPMAIETTEIFRRHSELFNKQDRQKAQQEDIFHFPGLRLTHTAQASKEINDVHGPKIIIAGAGMLNGGRILHHAKRYLGDEKSTLLIVGYQVVGSMGRRLLDGEKDIKIHGERIAVKANVTAIGAYSAHADSPKLIDYVDAIHPKPQKIFITHGELEQSNILAQELKKHFNVQFEIPKFHSKYNL